MSKFKQWLYNKFLPSYCRDALVEENARLTAKLRNSEQEIDHLNAYIDGLHAASRRQPRITINCKEVGK